MKTSVLLLLGWLWAVEVCQARSQPPVDSTRGVIVEDVLILGNKRTKAQIIRRELDFSPGDTLFYPYAARLERNSNMVFNTRLFVTVQHSFLQGDPDTLTLRGFERRTLLLVVKERWYTFPSVTFKLADRNFNEWWTERDRDISRTEYGIRFAQNNVRGRNETLKLKIQGGFTQLYELEYTIPYVNRRQTIGLELETSYRTFRALSYQTVDHKLIFTDQDIGTLRRSFLVEPRLTLRTGLFARHRFALGFFYNSIADTVAALNPRYFNDGATRQRFFSLGYRFDYDRRDVQAYALRGHRLWLSARQRGLLPNTDLRQLQVRASGELFRDLGQQWYWAGRAEGMVSTNRHPPYTHVRALGFANTYVRGYELYVMDGQHYGLVRTSLRRRLFSTQPRLSFIPIPQFRTVPIELYAVAFADAGYVSNNFNEEENQRFSNTLLGGVGAGLNLVTYYDLVIRFEGALNRAGETGFYLNFRKDI